MRLYNMLLLLLLIRCAEKMKNSPFKACNVNGMYQNYTQRLLDMFIIVPVCRTDTCLQHGEYVSLTILQMKLCGENYTLPLMLPLHFVLSALIYDILSIIADIKNFDFLHCKKETLVYSSDVTIYQWFFRLDYK